MKYDKAKELEKLREVNEKLVKFMKEYPKETLSLTAIGNSISNGFSMSEPDKLLLDRNPDLKYYGNKNGLNVETYQLSRLENNNALAVYDWIINNYSERDSYTWNIADYERYIKEGNLLLTESEIASIFRNGNDKRIQDVIFDNDDSKANVVIVNLGTGSFLDVVTRRGKLTLPNVLSSLDRDIYGIVAILELIQNNNRRNNSNTQVYLCGAPRIANTPVTDIFMNSKIKKAGEQFANVTYVPSIPRQAFYKAKNGLIILDPHYNRAEYYHLLSSIENKIIDNYFIKELLIDLDRVLYQISCSNDINKEFLGFTKDELKDAIDRIAKKYENKTGDYNYFIEFIKPYIQNRYPFDFYRASDDKHLVKELNGMKRK